MIIWRNCKNGESISFIYFCLWWDLSSPCPKFLMLESTWSKFWMPFSFWRKISHVSLLMIFAKPQRASELSLIRRGSATAILLEDFFFFGDFFYSLFSFYLSRYLIILTRGSLSLLKQKSMVTSLLIIIGESSGSFVMKWMYSKRAEEINWSSQ